MHFVIDCNYPFLTSGNFAELNFSFLHPRDIFPRPAPSSILPAHTKATSYQIAPNSFKPAKDKLGFTVLDVC